MHRSVPRNRPTRPNLAILFTCFLAGGWLALPPQVQASSHREAPGIAGNPAADNTDVYFFVSPKDPNKVVLVGCWWPMEDPAGGPNYFHFADDVDYAFHIDSDGDAKADLSYLFRFKTQFTNPNTALYATGAIESLEDADWNYRQSYQVIQVGGPGGRKVLGNNLAVPPVNIGPRTTPNYESLAASAEQVLEGDIQVFAGQRDDPFFVDLGAIFDLLGFRAVPGNRGQGLDDLSGTNVQAIVMEVPISRLTKDGSNPSDPADAAAVLGLWSTSIERASTGNGSMRSDVLEFEDVNAYSSSYRQVSRLGMPLVNEVVIPIGMKNKWNRSHPQGDAQFLSYVQDPELARLIEALYGVTAPPTPRCDLVAIFLTGVPGLNQPPNVTPSEQIRLNVAIKPDKFPDSRFGVVGGDLDGFPNGRRLADDVVDISERAVAGVLYPLFCDDTFEPHPLAGQLGDGVDQNDLPFQEKFPYLALPHSGWDHDHHRVEPAHDPQSTRRVREFAGIVADAAQSNAPAGGTGASTARFELSAPRPNPVSGPSQISFSLAETSRVDLKVFDVAGRAVRTLAAQEFEPGSHVAKWDGLDDRGRRVSPGIYMVQLTSPKETASRKMTVIR